MQDRSCCFVFVHALCCPSAISPPRCFHCISFRGDRPGSGPNAETAPDSLYFHDSNRPSEQNLNGSYGSVSSETVLGAQIKNEEGHFHHPLFPPFWRVFVPRLLVPDALLCSREEKTLFVGVRRCSSGITGEAVNEAVTSGHRGSCPNAPSERSCHGQKSTLWVILPRLDGSSALVVLNKNVKRVRFGQQRQLSSL